MTPEQRRKQLDDDLSMVAATEGGRRVLWGIIDGFAGAVRGSFAGENAHTTSFNEGRRHVGLRLLGELQRVAPDAFTRAWSEASRDVHNDRVEAEMEAKKR